MNGVADGDDDNVDYDSNDNDVEDDDDDSEDDEDDELLPHLYFAVVFYLLPLFISISRCVS